jgi:hypothetical protein
VARTEAQAAEGDAKTRVAPRTRKKPAAQDAAAASEPVTTEAKVEGSAGEPAPPAAKAKTTIRRPTKKTGE